MFTEQQNFNLAQTEVDEVFRQNYQVTIPPGYATAMSGDVFKVTQTTHAAYIGTVHKGPSLFSKIGEVQAVPTYAARSTNKWTVTISAFAEGIEISKDLFDDDMHGEWQAQVADFATVALRTQDYNAFKVFRGAFTVQLTPDGVSAVNTAHPLIGGGTTGNQVTSALAGTATSALTTTTFNYAMKLMAEMKSHANVPLQCVGSILVVPPAIYITARQLAASALVPENGNNAVNVFSMDYSIKVYQSVFLGTASGDSVVPGSDSAWFLLDAQRHAIRRFVRQGIQTGFRDWATSNNRTYYFQANFREEVYIADYVGLVGATGL